MPLFFAAIATALLGVLFGTYLASRGGRQAIAGLTAHIIAWAVWAATRIIPEVSFHLAKLMLEVFKQSKVAWAPMLGAMVEELTGTPVDVAALGALAGQESIREIFKPIVKPVADSLLAAMAPPGEISGERAQENLSSVIATTTGLNIGAWFMEYLVDALELGHLRSIVDLRLAFDQSLALQRLGFHLWSAPMKKGISEPLEQLYDERYAIKLPPDAEVVDAWQQGLLTDDQVLTWLRRHGFNYERATLILNARQKRLSPAEAGDLYRTGAIGEDQLLQIIRHGGFGEERAALIYKLEQGKRREGLLGRLATHVMTLYQRGKVTKDELATLLREAHFKDDEIELAVLVGNLENTASRDLSETQLLDAFGQGVLDALTVRGRLRHLGFDDQDIDVLLALHTKKLVSRDILEAAARGLVSRADAINRLTVQGYSAEDATLLLDLRVRTLSEGQVIDALRVGTINVQTARAQLQALGFGTEVVDIILSFVQRRLTAGDIQGAVLRGLLTPEQGHDRLLQLGFSAEDATLIIELRTRLLTTGEVLDVYAAGFLTRTDTLARLSQLGFAPGDAEILVRLVEQKKAAQGTEPGLTTQVKPPRAPRKRPTP